MKAGGPGIGGAGGSAPAPGSEKGEEEGAAGGVAPGNLNPPSDGAADAASPDDKENEGGAGGGGGPPAEGKEKEEAAGPDSLPEGREKDEVGLGGSGGEKLGPPGEAPPKELFNWILSDSLAGASGPSDPVVVRFRSASQASEEEEGSAGIGEAGGIDGLAPDKGAPKGGAEGMAKGLESPSVAGGGVSPKEAASGSPALTLWRRSAQPPLPPESAGVKATVESTWSKPPAGPGVDAAPVLPTPAGGANGFEAAGGGVCRPDVSASGVLGGGGGGGGGGGAKDRDPAPASIACKEPLEGALPAVFFLAAAAASLAISREERDSLF